MTNEQPNGGQGFGGGLGFDEALRELGEALARHPEAAEKTWMRFAGDCMSAGAATLASSVGSAGAEPVVAPLRADRRFRDPSWHENPVYFGLQQGYLLWSRLMRELVDAADLDGPADGKARFAVDAMIDALAPTNTLVGNPAALRRAMETRGTSVTRGMERFLDDVVTNDGRPSQVDLSRFELGHDLAATAGQVVFRNELIELIQYQPTTRTVHAVPLLLSPPWINKYYVLDLSPGRSFVEWAVARGHTVFAISYVNPGSEHRDSGLDDYLRDGLLAALDVVGAITRCKQVNVAALCLGGTLAGAGAAYLAAAGDHRVRSLTLFEHAARLPRRRRAGDVRRRRVGGRGRCGHEREGLSRCDRDGAHVRRDARERPDLELRRQRLAHGRAAVGLRPARLECRLDAHAGPDARRVPARVLHGEPLGRGDNATAGEAHPPRRGRRPTSTTSPPRTTTSRPGRAASRRRTCSRATSASS